MVMVVPPEAALIPASYKADFEEKTDERYKIRYVSLIAQAYARKGAKDPRAGLWEIYNGAKRKDLFVQALILTTCRLAVRFHPETAGLYSDVDPLLDSGDDFDFDG